MDRHALTGSTLARKLTIYIVFLGLFATLASTAIQLYLSYRQNIRQISDDFALIEASYLGSLVDNIWVYNDKQIGIQLDGMLGLPGIEYVYINIGGQTAWSSGAIKSDSTIEKKFELIYREGDRHEPLGTLSVIAGLDHVYNELLAGTRVALVISIVAVFLAAGAILLIFRNLVTRHMTTVVHFVNNIDIEQEDVILRLNRPSPPDKKADELDHVVDAINNMRRNLLKSITALKNSEERFRAFVEQAGDALFVTDLSTGKFIDVNQRAHEGLGYTREELLRLSVPDIDPSFPAEKFSEFSRGLLPGKPVTVDGIHQRKDGTTFPVEICTGLVEIRGRRNLLALARDITERKQAEEEKAELQEQLNHRNKMDAIGQLAGGVAHDFNNMLAGIMGAAELLCLPKRNLDEKGKEYVDVIMQASERAADLTSKLLAFGRKGKTASTAVDVHSIIDDTTSILNRTIDKKIRISVRKDAGNNMVIGDNSGLQNALMNIGINASHAMPDGGEIQIETENIRLKKAYCDASPFEIEPGEYIEIEIRDTGCGIPLENIQKIFEPFYTTKEQGKGSGLGLSAVYGTVQDHHGAINVYSEVGGGTSFHILLPCSEESVNYKQTATEMLVGSGQILLVDDEEIIRITGESMLKEMGYQVLLAENGQEAVEIFQNQHAEIDLVIMDMIMPEMNGREAFIKMCEIDKNCKVIISSGFAKNESLDELRESGLAGFIRKPYRDFELSQLLTTVLSNNVK